jgi:hypothetical protein
MSTMIERVAQALQQEMATGTFDKPPTSFALARAAIAAMREPTEEMIDAWISAPGAIKGGWQGMIDAALEGK